MTTLLIVDDDPIDHQLIRAQFKNHTQRDDIHFVGANCGYEALDILEKTDDISVIVSDIAMPEMDGLELLHHTTEKYPLIKTVIVTAHNQIKNIRKAMNEGAYDFLVKPFKNDDLVATIERAITESKRFRAMIAAQTADHSENQSKSEFMANVSHELITPIHGILNFSKFGIKNSLSTQPNIDKIRAYFMKISDSASRLSELIQDILMLSNIEARHIQYHIKKIDCSKSISAIVQDYYEVVTEAKAVIRVCEPDFDSVIEFDPYYFAQVIKRLLDNATQYTRPEKEIIISFEQVLENDNNPDSLVFSVKDQGIGIPEQELKSIFKKFIQSSKTDTGAGGKGLGLAICREIIKYHRGTIWAENNSHGGATIFCKIPYRLPESMKV